MTIMKKHKLYSITFSFLFGLFTLTSCDGDLLETVPNDRLSESVFWKTESDAKLAVNSLYTDLDDINIISWDALTDIAHTNQSFNVQAYIELGTFDATNSKIYNEWKNAYTGIRATNYFLANADKVPFTNPQLLNQYQSEARVLRAYQYIKLSGLYGEVPLITSPVTIAEAQKLTRTPIEQIWNFIEQELTESADKLPETYANSDKGRITKGAALGLLVRSSLFAGRYQKAAETAQKIIQSGTYGMYESYEKLFTYAAENNREVLLDKQFVKDIYPNNIFQTIAPYSQKNGSSTYVPTKALADLYETADGKNINNPGSGYNPAQPYQNRDNRFRYSVFLEGDVLPSGATFQPRPDSGTPDAIGNTYIATTTGYNIKKYINTEDFANPVNSGINIILLRYPEILLSYAEAKIELNQIDHTVLSAINLVRNGRNDVKQPSITTLNQTELRDIVRNERAVELAFEGLRLFDIRRWKTAENIIAGTIEGITYSDNNNNLVTIQVAANKLFDKNRHYLWPIPQKERDLNSSLTQNQGW